MTTNTLTCTACTESITGSKVTLRVGSWDADRQNYARGRPRRQQHYCRDCWRTRFSRDAAAYYPVDDVDQLWAVLAAAAGELVADLSPLFVGSRPFVRVVDDDIDAVSIRPDPDATPATRPHPQQTTLTAGTDPTTGDAATAAAGDAAGDDENGAATGHGLDSGLVLEEDSAAWDRDRLRDVIRAERNLDPGPAMVLLKPVGETPFADVRPADDDGGGATDPPLPAQQRLEEVSE